MAHSDRDAGFRNPALAPALDHAIGGDTRELFELLGRLSGLPGPRANMGLVGAFTTECVLRGERVDALVTRMARLDVDAAPGATKWEIIPMCGVAALGGRAAADPTHVRALATLHDSADDLRFRVREAVILSLARIGEVRGAQLVHDLASWMDGFFHAAAVLTALADPAFLTQVSDGASVLARLDEAFILAREAPRATSRYPGYKALVDALGKTPGVAAARFGQPVFDLLERWAVTREPVLREAIEKNLKGSRLAGRFAPDLARVHLALEGSAKVRRDPLTYVGPTRGRGRKRSR